MFCFCWSNSQTKKVNSILPIWKRKSRSYEKEAWIMMVNQIMMVNVIVNVYANMSEWIWVNVYEWMYRPKHLSNQPKTLSILKSFFKYKIYNILSLFMLFSLKSNSNSMTQPTERI